LPPSQSDEILVIYLFEVILDEVCRIFLNFRYGIVARTDNRSRT